MPSTDYVLEICVESLADAQAAEKGGAHRLELASSLLLGGVTPSWGLLERVFMASLLDIVVLIRPRPGDFCFDEQEMQVMERDIVAAKEIGVAGVAIGVLDKNAKIDREKTKQLIETARPLSITFHRAFDMTADLHESLSTLIDLGVDRVLTSGGKATAVDGKNVLAELNARAGESLIVMPGSGLRASNIVDVAQVTQAREFHLSASRQRTSSMTYQNDACSMGASTQGAEYEWRETDANEVANCVQALNGETR